MVWRSRVPPLPGCAQVFQGHLLTRRASKEDLANRTAAVAGTPAGTPAAIAGTPARLHAGGLCSPAPSAIDGRRGGCDRGLDRRVAGRRRAYGDARQEAVPGDRSL